MRLRCARGVRLSSWTRAAPPMRGGWPAASELRRRRRSEATRKPHQVLMPRRAATRRLRVRTTRRRRRAPPRRGSSRRRRRRERRLHRRQELQRRMHQERPHRRLTRRQCRMPTSQLVVCARRRRRFRRRWLRHCSVLLLQRRLLQPTRVLRTQRAARSLRRDGVRVPRLRGWLHASPRPDASCVTQQRALLLRRPRRRDWRLAWHRCGAPAWMTRLLSRCHRRRCVPPRRRLRPSRPPHLPAPALLQAATMPTTTATRRPGRRDGRRSNSLRMPRRLRVPD